MRKILCFAVLLLSCVTQGHAQYFAPVLLDAETAQEHIKASKKKIVTHNTRDLMSASESDTWTDGEKYYTGWPDGNKYQIFYSKEPGDIASTPIKELVARGMSFQNPEKKGSTVRYQTVGPWRMLVFYDPSGKPTDLLYASNDSKYNWTNPSLDYQTVLNGVYSLKECNADISEGNLKKASYTKMVFGGNWYIPKGENAFEDYRENDPGVYTLQTEKGPHHLLMGFHRYKKVPLPPIPHLERRVEDGVECYYADGVRIPKEQYRAYEAMTAPGYKGNAAEGSPADWDVELTIEGMTVNAHPTQYIWYHPDFGTLFSLTKDCSAYGFDIPGRWAYASVRPLTRYMLSLVSKETLVLMRGEIYARHGDTFKNPETQKYFDAQPWYKKSTKPVVLTDIERLNVALIKAEESRR